MLRCCVWLAAGAACLLVSSPLPAQDFARGVDAFNKGDYPSAVNEWNPLAERGDAKAQYMLGILYKDGKGVERDYKLARKWFEAAAAQGSPSALYWLGWMNEYGKGMWLWDRDKALDYYIAAAKAGNADAQIRMGEHSYDTAGRAMGIDKFRQWVPAYKQDTYNYFLAAAQKGRPIAQVWVGELYENGYGVDQDYAKAMAWYKRALTPDAFDLDGNRAYRDEEQKQFAIATALTAIGEMYRQGHGVPVDVQIATKYDMDAASHGGGWAMSLLGQIWESGANGMPRDSLQAYMWYTLAVAHCWNDDFEHDAKLTAEGRLNYLNENLPPEEIELAKKMAATKHFPATISAAQKTEERPIWGVR